jgi:hypothetical protein
MLPLTSATAAILTVLYIGLALRVIYLRRTGVGPSVGLGEDERFLRAVRAHGNFSEYAPLFLILLFLAELQGAAQWLLGAMAVSFIAGRVVHAAGFGFIGRGPWRTIGMVLTNTALLAGALAAAYFALL